ncbi:cell wall-binding repeat-containing protein [Metabacillus idriensis]|uniref:cell wall-binding repeat-containing protein n=1 Tax=Metabacillus idriensis TaxID=324768 RepID=UPI00174A63C7|nr:cell wall-binding repeat-containing protein [Metabacillus idriensis]
MKKAIILSALLTLSLPFGQAKAEEMPTYRISGADRYETSVNVSKEGWETSDVAVISTGRNYPDALSATPLAYKNEAPLLLTDTNSLPKSVKEELKRLKVKKVILIGGTAVIGANVEKEIKELGINSIQRIGGADRYETSVNIANEVSTYGEVVVATGQSFADALSIAPIAAQLEMPILLTKKDEVPAPVANYIQTEEVYAAYVIGGNQVISEKAANKLPDVVRLSGETRYETNSQVIDYFSEYIMMDTPLIATGKNYPDALAGSALASYYSNPIILTDPVKAQQTTKNTVQTYSEFADFYYIIGGQTALPDSAVEGLFN